MLYPVIDIGSNTVKLAVLDEDRIDLQAPVYFKAVPLNLRSKTQNNTLKSQDTDSLCHLLKSFINAAKRFTQAPPLAFATASLRGLENEGQIVQRIFQETGLHVRVLSGEEEAYFSFLGARQSLPVKAGMVVDLGGGSTELLTFRKNRVEKAVSLPFGCLTLYHRFFADEKQDYENCEKMVMKRLKEEAPFLSGNSILLTGGSAKAVLKYKNVLEEKRTFTLGTAQMRKVRRHYEKGDTERKEKVAAILKDRFRLIPPALAVFSQITEFYGKEQVFVCRGGVREGYLFDYLQKN